MYYLMLFLIGLLIFFICNCLNISNVFTLEFIGNSIFLQLQCGIIEIKCLKATLTAHLFCFCNL